VNEAETRAELIDPALKDAGWGVVAASRVRREVITLGGHWAAKRMPKGSGLALQHLPCWKIVVMQDLINI
jgi:type I site-specific restriction endonuclease